ncbi:MAG: type I restriction enzyme HsdR N-terminal domain-containing protein [Bacteroidales bacterium]|nr:type I restriction enzyme HsdR N-terminal domain-containing protein [Bacteroidales bacterium]
MERDLDILKRVTDFLIQHGYPEESIMLEWKVSSKYRVDMAVIDNISKRPVALFEFKRQRRKESENIAIEQLKKYAEILGDDTIPLYLVFGADNTEGFEIYFLTEDNGKEVLKLIPTIPQFRNLKNSFLSKAVSKNEKDKKKFFNWFRFICWFLASIIFLLLYFDFKGCISITTERLGIIAIIIGLVIVPFARKLKILGLEFERLIDDKEKKYEH